MIAGKDKDKDKDKEGRKIFKRRHILGLGLRAFAISDRYRS